MKFNLIEAINTVSWSEGIQNAPASLVTIAKAMAEKGEPATFGRVDGMDNKWVILSVGEANNQLYVAHRDTANT